MAQAVFPQILDRWRFEERFECWNRGELEPMLDMYAEDGVFDVSAVFTDVAPMRGHQNMLRYWNELRETWEGIRTDPVEMLNLGDGRYVLDLRLRGKGRRSGAEVDQRFAFLYTIRLEDRKVISAQLFPDVATAIAVAKPSASQTA